MPLSRKKRAKREENLIFSRVEGFPFFLVASGSSRLDSFFPPLSFLPFPRRSTAAVTTANTPQGKRILFLASWDSLFRFLRSQQRARVRLLCLPPRDSSHKNDRRRAGPGKKNRKEKDGEFDELRPPSSRSLCVDDRRLRARRPRSSDDGRMRPNAVAFRQEEATVELGTRAFPKGEEVGEASEIFFDAAPRLRHGSRSIFAVFLPARSFFLLSGFNTPRRDCRVGGGGEALSLHVRCFRIRKGSNEKMRNFSLSRDALCSLAKEAKKGLQSRPLASHLPFPLLRSSTPQNQTKPNTEPAHLRRRLRPGLRLPPLPDGLNLGPPGLPVGSERNGLEEGRHHRRAVCDEPVVRALYFLEVPLG